MNFQVFIYLLPKVVDSNDQFSKVILIKQFKQTTTLLEKTELKTWKFSIKTFAIIVMPENTKAWFMIFEE